MTIPKQLSNGKRKLTIVLERSDRLTKTVRWLVKEDDLILRVPSKMSIKQITDILEGIKDKVFAEPIPVKRSSDAELETLARTLNLRYFDGALQWNSIRWVNNMEKRLGSCTAGGPTDGDIRISTKLQPWPSYVLEYVVAHEICHRQYADHSAEFWSLVARYPQTERARGFVEGLAYAQGFSVD